MSKKISRRNLLKGVGAGALGLGLGAGLNGRALAQLQPSDAPILAFYQFNMGELRFSIIKDGAVSVDPQIFGTNATRGEIDGALILSGIPRNEDNSVNNLFDVMVIQSEARTILMDTGIASPDAALLPAMEVIGIDPNDVTDVVLTHFHGDHVGKVSLEGEITFPQAMHYFPRPEIDYLNLEASREGTPEAVTNALLKLQPVLEAEQIDFYSDGDEMIPGIQAVEAPGHTPGHHAILIDTGEGELFNMVDTDINAYINLSLPTHSIPSDGDPGVAAETRVALLNRAVEEQLLVFGYHFPFPGVGYIIRERDGFRFVPNAF